MKGISVTDKPDPLDAWHQDAWDRAAPYGAPERAAAIFGRIAALEALGKQMRQELIADLEAADLTTEEVAEIYWRFDNVPMSALGEQKEVWAAAVAYPYWSWRCEGCGAEIFIQTRAEKQRRVKAGGETMRLNMVPGSLDLCTDCGKAEFAERSAAWHASGEQRRQRERNLRTMPYRQYLLTPEWQERRKAALSRAGYKCQVCNRSRQLHVHHRTYERRGVELARDLIVLCDECHALYHGKGLLPAHEE